MIYADAFDTLIAVAHSVGRDANNPEGGLRHDSSNAVILETICDIAQGTPYKLSINQDDLSEMEETVLISAFNRAANDL